MSQDDPQDDIGFCKTQDRTPAKVTHADSLSKCYIFIKSDCEMMTCHHLLIHCFVSIVLISLMRLLWSDCFDATDLVPLLWWITLVCFSSPPLQELTLEPHLVRKGVASICAGSGVAPSSYGRSSSYGHCVE